MAQQPKKKKITFSLYWMYAVILLFLFGMFYIDQNAANEKVSYSRFADIMSDSVAARDGGIKRLLIYTKREFAEAYVSDSLFKAVFPKSDYNKEELRKACITTEIGSGTSIHNDIKEWQLNRGEKLVVDYDNSGGWGSLLWSFGPIVLLVALWVFFFRRMSLPRWWWPRWRVQCGQIQSSDI